MGGHRQPEDGEHGQPAGLEGDGQDRAAEMENGTLDGEEQRLELLGRRVAAEVGHVDEDGADLPRLGEPGIELGRDSPRNQETCELGVEGRAVDRNRVHRIA